MGGTLEGFDARFAAADARLREVRVRFAAVGFDLYAEGFDRVAYYRDVIEAETALARVFESARQSLRVVDIVWSALYDAERLHLNVAEESRRQLAASVSDTADTASALGDR
jgi:hypothetical protein